MTDPDPGTTMQAELRAVDDALDSGIVKAAGPVERELQELALALRAQAPQPSSEFEAELRARVRHGFPRERRIPMPSFARVPKPRRPPLPLLAGAASVLVAIAVAVSLTGGEEDDPGRAALQRPAAPSDAPADGGSRAPESSPPGAVAPVPPIDGRRFAPGERERRIERSASLTLAARGDRLDQVADQIVRLTDRHEGFVLRSSLSTGDEGTTGGDFELRIPAARLQAALAELSRLGDVRARTQSGQDVTREFVSAEERLEAARAERRGLLRRLERAGSDAAAEAIRRRLDLNAGEIRGLRGQVRDLRTRTDYASVAVTLRADDEGGASPSGSDGGLGGALDDALESLGDSAEIAIRVLGVALPLGLVAAGGMLGARHWRRRRREAALG